MDPVYEISFDVVLLYQYRCQVMLISNQCYQVCSRLSIYVWQVWKYFRVRHLGRQLISRPSLLLDSLKILVSCSPQHLVFWDGNQTADSHQGWYLGAQLHIALGEREDSKVREFILAILDMASDDQQYLDLFRFQRHLFHLDHRGL